MAGLDEVLRRIANDAAWADQVRLNPTEALRGYDLGPDELVRLERALGVHPTEPTRLFESGPAAAGAEPIPAALAVSPTSAPAAAASLPAAARLAGMPWRAMIAGVATAGAGLALGLTGVLGSGSGAMLRPDAATYYDCSDDLTMGAALGDLHRGDQVWIIGRSGASWAVIRHPDNPGAPAWMARASLTGYGDLGGLTDLTCSTALAAARAPQSASATTATTQPTTAPPTSIPPTPTQPTAPAGTTAPPRPTTPTPTRSQSTTPRTSATPSPSSPTSTPKDTTGPTLTLTTDSGFLYSEGSSACTAYRQQVTLTVAASDPSGATVTGVTWSAGGRSGAATALGSGRFRVGPIYSNHSGTIPMTLTVTARDGLGNTSTSATTVDFRQIAEACIG